MDLHGLICCSGGGGAGNNKTRNEEKKGNKAYEGKMEDAEYMFCMYVHMYVCMYKREDKTKITLSEKRIIYCTQRNERQSEELTESDMYIEKYRERKTGRETKSRNKKEQTR